MKHAVLLLLALLVFAAPAQAVLPSEQLADPKLEARARVISQELRCVVCQNETIDDSGAPLAHDLRLIVRERLMAGDSNDEVKAWLVRRYGAYVLLKPPLEPATLFLWFGPLVILLAGAAGAGVYLLRRTGQQSRSLSTEEEMEVARMLGERRG